MKGRKPKPKAQKELDGNPGKRRLKREPKPTLGEPEMPAGLCAEAKREWARVIPELSKMAILAVCDGAVIAGYCQTRARYLQAEAIVERDGPVVDEPILVEGKPSGLVRKKKHPAVTVANNAAALMKSFAAELGLSASSRARLDVMTPTEVPGSRLASFLSDGGEDETVQ